MAFSLRSLQLRDSYGFTPYSLLILAKKASLQKPKAMQMYNNILKTQQNIM